jgi:hypothetical protein
MFSAAGGEFMASGKAARHEDVSSSAREQILNYCRRILARSPYPADEFYPDIAGRAITAAAVGPRTAA